MTDVTARLRAERERAELEARLHQTQRLETVGQLAGGVAHDFNNLLSVIQGYADYVDGEVADRPGAVAGIAEIRRAADRAASLTRQLLTFGRRDVAHPERVDLRSVVRDVRGLLGRTLDEQVELRLELPDEPACVEIDVHQFEQVLLNLSVNARDAMPDGGRLTLALRRRDDGCVELTAADSGTGMTDEVRARAFDPFFTTKPSGQGTGLGLATVYGIVSQAGGEVRLESEPGKGTRVVVELPGAPEAAGEADGAAGPEARPARGQTILLVEDEAPVRAMAAQILRRHGYEVVEAASAQEALASFRALDPPPDLVLTDVAMPRMSGVELAARLGKSSPPVVSCRATPTRRWAIRTCWRAAPASCRSPSAPPHCCTAWARRSPVRRLRSDKIPAWRTRRSRPSWALATGRSRRLAEITIPVTDEGFLRGDGVFEVIRVYDGDRLRARRAPRPPGALGREPAPAGGLPRPSSRARSQSCSRRAEAATSTACLRIVVTRGGRRLLFTEPLRPSRPACGWAS